MWKLETKKRQFFVVSLRHKVVNLWLHGANFNDWKFGTDQRKKIIEFLQSTYPKYEKFNVANSFVHHAISRFRDAPETPIVDPFRYLKGENKPKVKRKNTLIVTLCDELLSEPKATAPKIQRGLRQHGFRVSLSTIYRIAKYLFFSRTKPWHTNILTTAQKYKRKLFCGQLLRLSDKVMLQQISRWMFTDEKWWDLVGPAASEYCKDTTKMERKLQNQVCIFVVFLLLFF